MPQGFHRATLARCPSCGGEHELQVRLGVPLVLCDHAPRSTAKEVGEATRQYQAVLEQHRQDPDDEHLVKHMQRTWGALNLAWVEHVAQLDAA